jgi:hypothetical protein
VLLGQGNRTPHGAVIEMNMEQWWNDIFAGETEVLGENLPSATLSTTNPTWIDPGANPGLRGEKPATNRLSHGTACRDIFHVFNKKCTKESSIYERVFL